MYVIPADDGSWNAHLKGTHGTSPKEVTKLPVIAWRFTDEDTSGGSSRAFCVDPDGTIVEVGPETENFAGFHRNG